MMITALVHVSKREPSLIALRMPSGIEIAYDSSVIHRPSEIDTGIFSRTSLSTLTSRK